MIPFASAAVAADEKRVLEEAEAKKREDELKLVTPTMKRRMREFLAEAIPLTKMKMDHFLVEVPTEIATEIGVHSFQVTATAVLDERNAERRSDDTRVYRVTNFQPIPTLYGTGYMLTILVARVFPTRTLKPFELPLFVGPSFGSVEALKPSKLVEYLPKE
jgi:hypothetical protein